MASPSRWENNLKPPEAPVPVPLMSTAGSSSSSSGNTTTSSGRPGVRRRSSVVWKYFNREEGGSAVHCNICSVKLSHKVKGWGTGSLLRHLRSKHHRHTELSHEVLVQLQHPPFVEGDPATHGGGGHFETAVDNMDGIPAEHQHNLLSLLDNLTEKQEELSKSEMVRHQIELLIGQCKLPLSIVEDPAFCRLVSLVDPGVNIPSVSETLARLKTRHEHLKYRMQMMFLQAETMALTTNTWTTSLGESRLTVSCHFINNNWELVSCVLDDSAQDKTMEPWRKVFLKLIQIQQEWSVPGGLSLEGKVMGCVHDDSSYMWISGQRWLDRGCTGLDWVDVACFGHLMDVAVRAGLQTSGFAQLVGTTCAVVNCFRKSATAQNALLHRQGASGGLLPCLPNEWQTVKVMFERLLEMKTSVQSALADITAASDDVVSPTLTDAQWGLMSNVIPIFDKLQKAVEVLSDHESVTISAVYPVIHGLLKTLNTAETKSSCELSEFKQAVMFEIIKNYAPYDVQIAKTPMIIAAVLDGRHKHLCNLPNDVRLASYNHMKQRLSSDDCPPDRTSSTPPPTPQQPTTSSNPMFDLLKDDYMISFSTSPSDDELEEYLNEPPLSLDANPLTWWKDNAGRFPRLSAIAREYLALPATSMSAQRFKGSGVDLSTSLQSDHLDMLVFLKSNVKFLPQFSRAV